MEHIPGTESCQSGGVASRLRTQLLATSTLVPIAPDSGFNADEFYDEFKMQREISDTMFGLATKLLIIKPDLPCCVRDWQHVREPS